MKCEEVELEVISNVDKLSAAAREHLDQCAACARFARTQELVLGAVVAARPSQALDQRVLAAVQMRMAAQRRWRRLLRLGGGILAPLAIAALLLLGMWLRLPTDATSGQGETHVAGGEQAAAVPELVAVAEDDTDLWLMSVAMTDVEMDDLEEDLAQLIAGTKESSGAPMAGPASSGDSGTMESRLADFQDQLMALEFELLGDL